MSTSTVTGRMPAYRLHRQSGQAIVTLNYGHGVRKDVPLGKFDSPESRRKYNRVLAEWLARDRMPEPPAATVDAGVTIAELCLRYWKGHVQTYYRHADGTPTSEQENIRQALRSLRSMYDDLPIDDFDPPKLKAWLHAVTRPTRTVTDPLTGEQRQLRGWCRTNANKHLHRIKAMFRWGMGEPLGDGSKRMLVTPDVSAALAAVPALRFGRTDARETEPVRPVSMEFYQAVKPHLSRQVAAIAELQFFCGARPGELCAMRTCELDTSQPVWIFRPAQHKNLYRGHTRAVPIGPEGQKVLSLFLRTDLAAYVFSPREAEAERLAALHRQRKTPMSCGNSPGTNRVENPDRKPGERYTVAAYRRAIQRACEQAFPPPAPLARLKGENDKQWRSRLTPEQREELRRWRREHRWHPHQARHTAATRAREADGAEGAQALLGHKHLKVTEVYAERSAVLAARVAAKIG